ncbi:MAG: hypothetical protein MUO26_04540 [Methanotrichaceae archaeon]|nr:hypothetical protein [Methanotrichaceae archaeon]
MKFKLAILILWLSIALAGLAYATDGGSDEGTFAAYPGADTGQLGSADQQQLAMYYPGGSADTGIGMSTAYQMVSPGGPTTMPGTGTGMSTAYQMVMPGGPTGAPSGGISPAYPGTPDSGGAVMAMYTTTAPPSAQQNVLLPYNIQAQPPQAVYYMGSYVPWNSFYTMFPGNQPMLWVNTMMGWGAYAKCPLGGWLQDLMYVPYTGTLKVYELYPDGSTRWYNYGFTAPGYRYIWFYADTPGRHITIFTVSDKPSNYITIDVY